MAERESKFNTMSKQEKTKSTGALVLSVLAILIASTTLAFSIYNYHDQTVERRYLAEQDLVIDKIVERAMKMDNEIDRTKSILQNILNKLPGTDEPQINIRNKRDTDEFDDDAQAEEDLSELSLTALSFLRGPPGFPGRDGRDGPQGPRGVSGPKGEQGSIGSAGAIGERGATGMPGLNGRDGMQGPVGPRGDSGERGPAGNPGVTGAAGLPGAAGEKGAQGEPGVRGERGLPGQDGSEGSPGVAGVGSVDGGVDNSQWNISSKQLSQELDELRESVSRLETIDAIAGSRSYKCPGWTREASMSQTLIGDICYVLVDQLSSWSEANDFCQGHSYNLVSFESSSKQSFIENWLLNTLSRASSSEIWTGGYRRSGTPVMEWLWRKDDTDEAFGDYEDWSASEPNSFDYCMANQWLKWYGRPCTATYNFVCEGPPAIERVDPQQSGGAVYTHWGRKTCANSSLTLYTGVVGGGKYDATGGGVNFQCLPPNPDLNDYNVHAIDVSWMRSVEYESQAYGLFGDQLDNTHAVCSRCYTRTRPAILMIPAKTSCPEDWVKEYSGFLMAGKEDERHSTTYECVDSQPEYQGLSPTDLGGRFWFVNADCESGGSIGQCHLYRHARQLTCVVCSK